MGGACSNVAKGGTDKSGRRMSFSAIKRTATSSSLKAQADYTATYRVKDTLNDRGLFLVVNKAAEFECVAKSIQKADMPVQDISSVEDHLQVLASLDHTSVCRFVEGFDCGDVINLIYEKAKFTSIFDEELQLKKGNPLDQEVVQVYARQIAMALSVAHKQGIVHGRLCPSSLLLAQHDDDNEKSIKISNIGQTFVLKPARQGKPEYVAPELLWDELSMPSNTIHLRQHVKAYQAVDLWAFGVLLYQMLTGTLPFSSAQGEDISEAIKRDIVKFGPEWDSMPDAREVVHSLLKLSGRIRITAEKVLKHQWLTLTREKVSRSKMMRVLQNALFNSAESTFKKFVMRVIAEDMSQEKLDIAARAFRVIDKNGDGSLEVEELRKLLKKYGEEEATADEIFDAIDRDASGTLNFAEFMAVSIGPMEYQDKVTLWHCFNRFDKGGSGSFDKAQIEVVIREVDTYIDTGSVESMLDAMEKDAELPINFDTFVQIMLTPGTQPVNKLKCTLDNVMYTLLKVDSHNVRHIRPKAYEAEAPSLLAKSPYSRSSITVLNSGGSPKRPSKTKGQKSDD